MIAHNGPHCTRIQGHLGELEELKAHDVRRAQSRLSGWPFTTLYHLMLVVVWDALVCAFLSRHKGKVSTEFLAPRLRVVDLYERDIRAGISWIPCIAWIKQAMVFQVHFIAHRLHI